MLFLDSINLHAKTMKILDPITCGFTKVFLYNLFTEPHNIVPNKGEPEKDFKFRHSQYTKFQEHYGIQNF